MTTMTERGAAPLDVLRELLADRKALTARIEAGQDMRAVVASLLAVVMIGGGIFGAAVGLCQGGWSTALAAVKLPVTAVAAAAICAPALFVTRHVLLRDGRDGGFARELARVLAAFALGSVILSALAPVMLLAVSWELPLTYQQPLAVACCGVGGAVGSRLLWLPKSDRPRTPRDAVFVASIVLVVAVVTQIARTIGPLATT